MFIIFLGGLLFLDLKSNLNGMFKFEQKTTNHQ